MKKILVISDTHYTSYTQIPSELNDIAKNFDYIIHCGDFISLEVVEFFKNNFKNFYGVVGNVDEDNILNFLDKVIVLEVRGFKVAITHPYEGGPPFGIKDRILNKIGEKVDLVLFGHTHIAEISEYKNVKFLNPGSFSGKFPALSKTFGIVEIDNKINLKIEKL